MSSRSLTKSMMRIKGKDAEFDENERNSWCSSRFVTKVNVLKIGNEG